ncbi:DUF397 domain-containing protein [Streptacidiphilus sp. 4-A2]|nr:DUF397 domain-containing protein [Streptacidiphilus sp. 4-A2]
MRRTYNGMAATEIDGVVWQKSRLSNSQGQCRRVGQARGRRRRGPQLAIPVGPALIYTRAEIAALLDGVKKGEFDHLAE